MTSASACIAQHCKKAVVGRDGERDLAFFNSSLLVVPNVTHGSARRLARDVVCQGDGYTRIHVANIDDQNCDLLRL
jgi:hypothetical protein